MAGLFHTKRGPMEDMRLNNHFYTAGLTILYFDHIVTLPDEIKYIWSRPRSAGSIWFFVNRYLAFFGNLALLMGNFLIVTSESERCDVFTLIYQTFVILMQTVVVVLLILRTYALYNRSRRMLCFLVSFAAIIGSATAWTLKGQKNKMIVVPGEGCFHAMPMSSAVRISALWWANFVFDALVCGLTLHRTWRTGERARRHDIVYVFRRDGAIYFAVMALSYLAVILSFYLCEASQVFFTMACEPLCASTEPTEHLSQPISKGGIAPLTTSIAITMASRLVLNLRRTSAQPAARALAHGDRLPPPERRAWSSAVARVELPRGAAGAELGPVLDIKAATAGFKGEEDGEERGVDLGWDGRRSDGEWPQQYSEENLELKVLR